MEAYQIESGIREQEKFYKERIGKVYGDYKVIDVWYDWDEHEQYWKMECTKCGFIKITKQGRDYVKGKAKGIHNCEAYLKKQKKQEEKERKSKDRFEKIEKIKKALMVFGKC